MTTIGEALVTLLERHGVDTVFGIPGVHTVELYRGLARSKIRHVTPRHEQGAGFMADGYARASGRPGVVFVITGPGLTNTLTAMAQARADSVPMLVVSGVNATPTLGKGLGYLHELPDQRGLIGKVALSSTRVEDPASLQPAIDRAFALFASSRPGPVHIEIPLDVMAMPAAIDPRHRRGRSARAGPRGAGGRVASHYPGAAAADPDRRRRKAGAGTAEGASRKAGRAGGRDSQCARPAPRPSAHCAGQPQPQGRARRD